MRAAHNRRAEKLMSSAVLVCMMQADPALFTAVVKTARITHSLLTAEHMHLDRCIVLGMLDRPWEDLETRLLGAQAQVSS